MSEVTTPQEIQREIDRTRESLSQDVDRLSDKVSPSKVVGRRVDSIKGTAGSVRDRVMGSASSAGDSVSNAGGSISSAASSVGDAASNAPQAARRQAQGNPFAAGIVAFGVGMLVASLLPASQQEQELASAAQDKATELSGPLQDKAKEIAGNLQEPAQQAAESIKAKATDAASTTVDQAKSSAQDVKEPMQQ